MTTTTPEQITAQLESLAARQQALETERNPIALAAFEGDPVARERHAVLESELATIARDRALLEQALEPARTAAAARQTATRESLEAELVDGLAKTEAEFEALLKRAHAAPYTIAMEELDRLYRLGREAYSRAQALHGYFREQGDKATARRFVRTWNLDSRFGPVLVGRVRFFTPGGAPVIHSQPWRESLATLRRMRNQSPAA